MSEAYWRIRPNEFIQANVREMAARAGQPYSRTLHTLLTEAIFARAGAERRRQQEPAAHPVRSEANAA
jgi:hypothetical protein